MAEKLKCLIIGSGPAGYTAGIYASRAGLNPVIIAGYQPGGQLTLPEKVYNFPGYPEVKSGLGIMEDYVNKLPDWEPISEEALLIKLISQNDLLSAPLMTGP